MNEWAINVWWIVFNKGKSKYSKTPNPMPLPLCPTNITHGQVWI